MTGQRTFWENKNGKEIAYNYDGERLGYLEYERVGAHMHYCWYQHEEIRMSPGCLQEVRDKQKELLKAIRQK